MSNGEEPEVTFVGGRAVEQRETLDSNLEVDEREAAKKAVREAIEKAGKESAESAKTDKAKDPFKPPGAKADKKEEKEPAKEKPSKEDTEESGPARGPDGKFLPKAGKPDGETGEAGKPDKSKDSSEPEEFDVEKASVKEMLKNRDRIAAMKKKASDDVSAERRQFEQERQQFLQQQYALQQQQAQLRQQAQALANLRQDPAAAVRAAGYDPEQFILDLAVEGTPEGKAQREMREMRAQIQAMQQFHQQQQLQAQQYQQQLHEQQVAQNRWTAVQQFVTLGMNEEKYPHVANFYKGRERALVAQGDLIAEEYRTLAGGRKEGSWEDILDYIEDQLAERTNNWYSKRSGGKEKEPTVKNEEEKPKSKGKSLNPDAGGERRTLKAKSLKDLDADERLEAARQAVAIALANSKE